jgi:hypothetical protein
MFHGAPSSLDVAREMQGLATALGELDLPETLRYVTRKDVERVGRELSRANPDRRYVADLARRTVTALDLGGALVAGSPALESLRALERWLKTAGRPLADALPA